MKLPDIQCSEPNIKLPIQQVGVEDIEIPFMLELKNGGFVNLISSVSMYGNLQNDIKGISMSRFIRTLKPYLQKPLKHFLIEEILNKLRVNLEVENVYMNFKFKLPLLRQSPVTIDSFPIYHKCIFEGRLIDKKFSFYQGIKIQYSSYCPCSAELCLNLKENGSNGFPHAQRAFCYIIVESKNDEYTWLEDIINIAEKSTVLLPIAIIKRIDEQKIAELARNNTMFVEDVIRNICNNLEKINIKDWFAYCKHEESIHTSNAVASSSKNNDNKLKDLMVLL